MAVKGDPTETENHGGDDAAVEEHDDASLMAAFKMMAQQDLL